jgi:RNA polymerase sigma-70 factor, ECF subfamily
LLSGFVHMSIHRRLSRGLLLYVDVSAVSVPRQHEGEPSILGGPRLDSAGVERDRGLPGRGRAPLWAHLHRRASDERLAERARLGDERAFQVLVERYRPRLVSYCASIAGDAGAQDAVQQTFINAWYALRKGCEVQCVRAWLFTVARRAALRVRSHDARTDELPELLAGGPTPEEQFELSRRARSALAAVAGLPANERDALVESSLQGRSGREVASALGLSEIATRQLIFRARARARAAFGAWAPVGLLARVPFGAGRSLRRGLAVAREYAANATAIQASGPLLGLAPVLASAVLVAAPVAAVELARNTASSSARARHAAARHAHPSAGAGRRTATLGVGPARLAKLAHQASPTAAPGAGRSQAPAPPPAGERTTASSAAAQEAVGALVAQEPLAAVPAPATPKVPAPAQGLLGGAGSAGPATVTGAVRGVEQLVPGAATQGVQQAVNGAGRTEANLTGVGESLAAAAPSPGVAAP